MGPQFHARATYRFATDASKKIDLIVYSAGHSDHAFELHVSTGSEPVVGDKPRVISAWRRENQMLEAAGFLLDSMRIVDHNFDL